MNNSDDGWFDAQFSLIRDADGGSVRVRAKDLRDELAMRAMQMFNGMDITCDSDIRRRYDFSEAASLCYQYADAMLKERAK